ncbi:LPS assembly protein LptD [Devosia sp.]|uniref:LPS-assembly protein LptD n=1 Tax=Devosia sp. TaxID=1871048 RepID=UPI003264B418
MRVWGDKVGASWRGGFAGALLVLALTSTTMAQVSIPTGNLVPADFFNAPINANAPSSIEADGLALDAKTGLITATGDVIFGHEGYVIKGQKLVYNRLTNDVHFQGAVTVIDPSGNTMDTENLEITGGMKKALVAAFTITSYDGARITADSADYDAALQTLLTNASYSPCGDCIDDKGRRIGWSIHANRITSNADDGSLYIEQPRLDVLGIPVAWLPFLWLPNTSIDALANVQMPSYDYSEVMGVKLEVPFRAFSSRNTDIIFTPTLLSRQGFLLGAEWVQRFDNGAMQIKASGLYQGDRAAFAGTVGDADWRGAIQTSGEFTPVENWTAGWSYTAFTDAAYLTDYRLSTAKSTINQVYARYLTQDTFIDARLQQFNLLGNVTAAGQGVQGQNLPVVRFDHVTELDDGNGRVDFSGRLLGVHRDSDSVTTVNGVKYVNGYAGNKVHASFQGGWQNQYIGTGGFVATPYLGGRADVAYYDGTSAILPGATTLWSATPIAAMDVRFPMSASDGSTVHLVEPIAQLVYRGSNATIPGITNDDSQGFVFDDTNLFSYNRFAGGDRQETGLRLNIGGRYQVDFADSSYLEVIAGQSFQIAGANAFAAGDGAWTGNGSGLDKDVSYAVLGAYGSFSGGLKAGGKVQYDTSAMRVARAGVSASYTSEAGYTLSTDYYYLAANAALGVLADHHEINVGVGTKVADYWTVGTNTTWDLSANAWLQSSVSLGYDDGYLQYGLAATKSTIQNETRITGSFKIKAPAGFNLGYTRQ